MSKLYVIIFLVALAGGVSTLGYAAFKRFESLVRENTELNNKMMIIEDVVQHNEETISRLQVEQKSIKALYDKTTKTFSNTKERIRESKRALTESSDTNASDKLNRCLEISSGSPLTQDEQKIGGSNAKTYNPYCPWFFGSQ